jgi:hypothetical protein
MRRAVKRKKVEEEKKMNNKKTNRFNMYSYIILFTI